MRKTTHRLLAVTATMALAVGVAGPALATNEVRVVVDPLNWNVSGDWQMKNWGWQKFPFSVQAGGGPQQIFTIDHEQGRTYFGFQADFDSATESLKADAQGWIENPTIGEMKKWSENKTRDIPIETSIAKFDDPATGRSFYEFKLFPTREATTAPPADLALQNLHQVQDDGVAPEECTVSRTLEPGDAVTTGGANDTVCITLAEGDGSADPITVATGDGNDVVLMSGDTKAPVEVNTGRGNDVIIADTSAPVSINGGEGHDAAVTGVGATFAGGAGLNASATNGDFCFTSEDLETMDNVDLRYDATLDRAVVRGTGVPLCD